MGETVHANPEAPHTAPCGRADAVRNRDRIVDAAREAFVISGPEVPLDEIARSAVVGNATLYRHFPDRDTLIRAVVHAVTHRVAERARTVLAEGGDAFEALRRFALAAAEERVGALCPMLSGRFDRDDPEFLAGRRLLEELTDELLGRAQRAGQVRGDIGAGDLMVVLSQLTRPLPGTGRAEFGPFAERHLLLFLDGLRTTASSELPGHPATLEALRPTA
ncbi:TetR/AcrR family transcriptional regulator [Streptomyces sp. AJS327]|uniref:TetR/AcrR family transcriptional regulator n=1 Tax=Streptomyces sp. AJS327 TaxID=2545265 RepID=UPI0027E51407|nr:TetR/AcrR family transcriptional regulator [Streptomyces sp. AJS327]